MALDLVIKGNKIGRNFEEPEVNQQYQYINVVGPTIVVAAQVGRQIQVTSIELSSDTLGTFTFLSDTDVILRIILTANGRLGKHSAETRNPLFSTSEGAALNISVSVVPTNAYLYIHYRYV